MNGMNPILPQYEHIPDGEPRVFGNRIYLFGSHDKSHGTEFCSEDYVCWSAPINNLCDWSYDGVIYRKEQDPLNKDGKHCMFAPDVVQGVDGRFYLYYALDILGQISVAVCEKPAGNYEFYGVIDIKEGPFAFDPGVLVDQGRVFLYYGFCPTEIDSRVPMFSNDMGSVVCELELDMITVKTEPHFLIPNFHRAKGTSFEGHPFFEASSIRKVKHRYYFIYSSILSHELCYAVSEFPDRGFVYGGILISNGDVGYQNRSEEFKTAFTGNNHGSIAQVNGQWYIFYHRHTQAIRCCRQACAEKIEILDNGFIPQVEITTSGLKGEALPAKEFYNSASCCNLIAAGGAFHIEGTGDFRDEIPYVTEENGEGLIANLQDKTQIGYKYFGFEGDEKNVTIFLRGEIRGQLKLYIDGGFDERLTGQCGKLIGEFPMEIKSEVWQKISGPIKSVAGIHSLFLVFCGEGKMDFYGFEIA